MPKTRSVNTSEINFHVLFYDIRLIKDPVIWVHMGPIKVK